MVFIVISLLLFILELLLFHVAVYFRPTYIIMIYVVMQSFYCFSPSLLLPGFAGEKNNLGFMQEAHV